MTLANSSIPVAELSGANATRELQGVIGSFNEATNRQTEVMITLTRRITWMTGAMLGGLVLQILLTVFQIVRI